MHLGVFKNSPKTSLQWVLIHLLIRLFCCTLRGQKAQVCPVQFWAKIRITLFAGLVHHQVFGPNQSTVILGQGLKVRLVTFLHHEQIVIVAFTNLT